MAARHFAASHRACLPQRRRVAPICGALALLAATATLSGCIADGPDGSPLAPNVTSASAATPAESDAAKQALTTGVTPSKSDVKIAAREARQARQSGTISGSAAIDRMIEQHARENGLPPALAYAVVRVESRYNPRARGGGALGLSQIKPATARSLGFSGPTSALFDADTNLTYGMKYLKGAWEQGGHDVCRASMKYKGGHRTTRMTSAALRYCSAVKAHMAEVMRQRSRRPGGATEPEEKGLIETLVATVAPDDATSGTRTEKAARTPTLSAFASHKNAKIHASNGSLLQASAKADEAATAKMTPEQAAAVAEVEAAPAAIAVRGPRAKTNTSSRSRSTSSVPAAAPTPTPADDGSDKADSRIADAFN